MQNFTEKRRQQFLTETYYTRYKDYRNESILLILESDAFENDEYNCGENERWVFIQDMYHGLMYIEYTAGKAIEKLIPLLEKVIDAYEKQAEALATFKKTKKPSIITEIGEMLSIIGLAYLLDRRDLLPRITTLINGENGGRLREDAITSRFLRFNDLNHSVIELGDEALYNPAYHTDWCKVIDHTNDEENKKYAVQALDEYLSDWYQMNKHELWYNSHLDLENKFSYIGYWAFEAAALVYLLDLDDRSLHKYLYYPKDIVQWIRNKKPNQIIKNESEQVRVAARESCPRSGYWFTVAQENSRQYFKQGDIFPDFESDWGDVYWQFDGDK